MALKYYIKVHPANNHVLEIHGFSTDDPEPLPEGLTQVSIDPHEFRNAMDPNHIMLWTEADGFTSIDIDTEEGDAILDLESEGASETSEI